MGITPMALMTAAAIEMGYARLVILSALLISFINSQDRISSQNHLDRIAIHITACLRINCASFIELGII
jgi:hypothetical protein